MHLFLQNQRNTKSSTKKSIEDPHPTFYHRGKAKKMLIGYNNFASMRHKTRFEEENTHFVKGYN